MSAEYISSRIEFEPVSLFAFHGSLHSQRFYKFQVKRVDQLKIFKNAVREKKSLIVNKTAHN